MGKQMSRREQERQTRRERLDAIARNMLRVVVGSHAHGTAGPASDTDIRSIFLVPTTSLVSLDPPPDTAKKEDEGDDNAWELAHFMRLCCKGSPTVLEVLLVEPFECTAIGAELRTLMPLMLAKPYIFNAFYGYANREKNTFLSPLSKRTYKSMGHYLRILYNGAEILRTGTMTVRITDTPLGQMCLDAKHGLLQPEEVLAKGEELIADLRRAEAESTLPDEVNNKPLNEFLLRVRRENFHWDPK